LDLYGNINSLFQFLYFFNLDTMVVSDGSRFDFVVVGGGTAGNTVAGRLAEDPNVTVLAGQPHPNRCSPATPL
jgi:hypothetical protein